MSFVCDAVASPRNGPGASRCPNFNVASASSHFLDAKHLHICINARIYLYAYTRICSHIRVCARIYAYIIAYIRIYTYIRAYTRIGTHSRLAETAASLQRPNLGGHRPTRATPVIFDLGHLTGRLVVKQNGSRAKSHGVVEVTCEQ